MKKIDQYIVKEFLRIFSLTLGILTLIYLVVHFFEHIDQFTRKQASLRNIISYFLNKLPLIFFHVTPFALLLSTVLTLGIFCKNNEITLLKCSGISIRRISIPFILIGMITSITVFILSEFIVPITVRRSNYIYKVRIKGEKEETLSPRNNLWLYGGDKMIWNIKFLDPEKKNIIRGITIFQMEQGSGIKQRIDADWGEWQTGKWNFNNIHIRNFSDPKKITTEFLEKKEFGFSETPEDFYKRKFRPEEMNFRALLNFIRKSSREGFDASKYMVDFFHKFSFPFTCLIMTLLGIPLCLFSNKHGTIKLGIGLSLLISFSVWVLLSFSISLGHAGVLPPFLSAWGTNIIFFCIGIYFVSTIE